MGYPASQRDRREAGYLLFSQVFETKVRGHPYNSEIRSYVPGLGSRRPASISRYSRTLTPISQAARQTLRPSRFRARCIIVGYAANAGTFTASNESRTRRGPGGWAFFAGKAEGGRIPPAVARASSWPSRMGVSRPLGLLRSAWPALSAD